MTTYTMLAELADVVATTIAMPEAVSPPSPIFSIPSIGVSAQAWQRSWLHTLLDRLLLPRSQVDLNSVPPKTPEATNRSKLRQLHKDTTEEMHTRESHRKVLSRRLFWEPMGAFLD